MFPFLIKDFSSAIAVARSMPERNSAQARKHKTNQISPLARASAGYSKIQVGLN
jgi:hypothetical protein